MSMNISSVGAMNSQVYIDPEHQRIMRELRALGLEPTGDKSTDKAKLEQARNEKKAEQAQAASQIQFVSGVEESSKAEAASSSDAAKDTAIQAQNMTGAEQLAKLNKLKLLGLY